MTAGRPLRFLAAVLLGWIGWRATQLMPVSEVVVNGAQAAVTSDLASSRRPVAAAGRAAAHADPQERLRRPDASMVAPSERPPRVRIPRPLTARHLAAAQAERDASPPGATDVSARDPSVNAEAAARAQALPSIPPFVAGPRATGPDRLAGSAWAVLREGDAAPFAGGRLGGAQAGVRVTYALGEARRVALAARVSTPLRGRGREGAIGLDWRPTRLPVRLLAEQRFALDGGARTGPALFVVGGLDPVPVAAGFNAEGYVQAGIAAGPFADGAARLARPLARAGGLRLDLGMGAWGGAQRGATRLDAGPAAALVVPVATRALRITLDYRRRVAGRAAPGSGPVLSIGSDF